VSNYSEQFLKQNPLAVLGVLRDLQKGEVPLRISWATNQFISKILEASPERLVIDLGSQEYENRAALRAENIAVMAETQGAKVEFVLPRLTQGEFQGLPAFITPCRLTCGLCNAANIFVSALRFIRRIFARRECRTRKSFASACLICPSAGWVL
jgi:c-di-GMP-binding flagellar brake protein YcgR